MKNKWRLFVLYILFLAYLLFVKNRVTTYDDYLLKLESHINIVPFATIVSYIKDTLYSDAAEEIIHAIINNLGNIIVFIPLGYFLNRLFCCHDIKKILKTSLIIISAIELIQLFTLTGSFDIDDIILNTVGILVGYLVSEK